MKAQFPSGASECLPNLWGCQPRAIVALSVCFIFMLANPGCAERSANAGDARTPLVILGASSLSRAFAALERRFETTHPSVDVQISTAGSQKLRMQVEQGLHADIFASANLAHLETLRRAGLVHSPRTFAHNRLVIAVQRHSPLRQASELVAAQRVVLGTAQVPVGAYARTMLARANMDSPDFSKRVLRHVVSEEPNVRLTLAKVSLGQADAAIVYQSDLVHAPQSQAGEHMKPKRDGLRAIQLPAAWQVEARYAASRLISSHKQDIAIKWMKFISGPIGQEILTKHGFIPASPPTAARPRPVNAAGEAR